MFRRAFSLLLLLSVATAQFNFETALRVVDKLESLLALPVSPIQQSALGFKTQFLRPNATYESSTRQFLWTQIVPANPTLDMIFLGFEDGMFIGYFNSDDQQADYIYTYQPNDLEVCDNTACLQTPTDGCTAQYTKCRKYLTVDQEFGLPIYAYRNRSYDPREREWYVKAKANGTGWTDPYTFATVGSLGLTFFLQLVVDNKFIGAAGIDYPLFAIDQFLVGERSDEQSVVFIEDSVTGLLIAASSPNVSIVDVNGTLTQVASVECEDEFIRSAAVFLRDQTEAEDKLFVYRGRYIQKTRYNNENGLVWNVVVTNPATPTIDSIEHESTAAVVLYIMGVFGIVVSICLGVHIWRYQQYKLWTMAQPPFLYFILFSNVLIYANALVIVGPNTDFDCTFRVWWASLSFTTACAAFLVKVHRVYIVGRLKYKTKKNLKMESFMRAVGMVGIQLVVLTSWTLVDGPKSEVIYEQKGLELIEREVCSGGASWGQILAILVIAALLICGCVVSVLTRNFSEAFAESRALIFTFYHGAILSVIGGSLFALDVMETHHMLTFMALGLWWFAGASQIAFFGPRLFTQWTHGDLTLHEVREHVKKHNLTERKESSRRDNKLANVKPSTRAETTSSPHVGKSPPRQMSTKTPNDSDSGRPHAAHATFAATNSNDENGKNNDNSETPENNNETHEENNLLEDSVKNDNNSDSAENKGDDQVSN